MSEQAVVSDKLVQTGVQADEREAVAGQYQRIGGQCPEALQRLENVARNGGNVFSELVNTVEVCSLGQITAALFEVGGQYRRSM